VPRADSPRLDVPRAFADGTVPLPRASLYLTLDAGVEEEGLHGLEASTDLAGDTARESVSRGKVARGMVHPYYAQLGKTLMKHWDADRAVSATGLKGLTEQWAQNTRLWNEIWLEHAGQYGKSGRPVDAPAVDNRMVQTAPGAPIAMGDLQQRRAVQKAMGEQFKSSRRAEIRVTQDAEGKLLKVELVKPSNDEHVDKEALLDVKAAAEQLPPPPPEALNGKTTLVSTWEFELIVSITPPVPTFSFEFDEVLGFVDTRMPLDRRIYKKVRLLAVE
jgi:TonB family protein